MSAVTATLVRLLGGLMMAAALGLMFSRAPDLPVESLIARWGQVPSDFIEVKGQLVHLRDEGPRHSGAPGEPAPIVLIHGTSASLHTWDGWAAALRGQRRVIRLDLPGFGLTGPNQSGLYSAETDARFVLDVLASLKVQRFVVGGNSLGGEVAWRIALQAPQQVDRLILVDAAGYAFTAESVPLGFRMAQVPALAWFTENLLLRALVEASVRSVYGDPGRVTPELVDRYFSLTLRTGNRRALNQRVRQFVPGEAAAEIARLKLPTLILWGGRDRLIPPENGPWFQRDIKGSELVMFSALGHVPHEEDPSATVVAVKRFLDGP